MLIRITNACHMGCSHCMVNATPDGENMTDDNFTKALRFTEEFDLPLVMISGGEPTEHPRFIDFIEQVKQTELLPVVLSNGMFLEDEAFTEKVLNLGISFQITNDARFYPKDIPKIKHPLLTYVYNIQSITPLGRAKGKIPHSQKAPGCFNIRSMTHFFQENHGSLHDVICGLRSYQKFCTPSINADGSISAGETNQCFRIGNLDSTQQELLDGLMKVKCNNCGLEDNLSPVHKRAIGQISIEDE